MSEQWIVTGEDQNGEYGVWSADGTKCLVSATSRHLATITAEYANETNAAELVTLKAQRDELLAALKRLGTSEAFTAYALGRKFDKESVARMEYARAAIANAEKDNPKC